MNEMLNFSEGDVTYLCIESKRKPETLPNNKM